MSSCATYVDEGDAAKDYATEASESNDLSQLLELLPLLYFDKSTTMIAEEFLSQFVSIFFGPFSDEPVIKFNDSQFFDDGRWIEQRAHFTDGYDNTVNDVPFILTLDETWMGWELDLFALDFRLFTIEDNSEPLIIAIRFESLEFSGGVYVLYEIVNNGKEFLQLGSMIGFHWGGPGPDYVRLALLISEKGTLTAHMFPHGWRLYNIDAEGIFELVADAQTTLYDYDTYIAHIWVEGEYEAGNFEHFTNEEIMEFLRSGQMQNFFPNFPDGNFVPMIRMYDLEQELTERITERLRGTFPIVER